MHTLIKKVPIPIAGLALGLAALGNLLQPYSDIPHAICGIAALALVVLLGIKIALFPHMIRNDLRNSILASVSATLFMALMQLATYLAPFAYGPAFALWGAAVAAHMILIGWFTLHFITRFKLREVFPTYFICYVGIIVGSVTSPTFDMEPLGLVLFWFGFACYAVLLGLVTYRYLKHEIPESARPLFCIYAAPMSLSLTGYLAAEPTPNAVFVIVLLALAQILLVIVIGQLPHFLRLSFYPSFAAMTFPFVISATAFGRSLSFFRAQGIAFPPAFDVLFVIETILATFMVTFVFVRYVFFLAKPAEQPQGASAVHENAGITRFSKSFYD